MIDCRAAPVYRLSHKGGKQGFGRLDSIERAIRDALAKGEAGDRAFREKVYRSVLTALERANAADTTLSPEAIERRRNVLKKHITEIEQEFIPAVAPAVEPARIAPTAGPAPEITARREEPSSAHRPLREDSMAATADDRLSAGDATVQVRRRPYAAMFVAVTLAAALAIGAWWAMEMGLFGRPDTSVPNPPQDLSDDDFTPDGPPALNQNTPERPRDWIAIFDPSDPSSVAAPAGAQAEVMADDSGSFLRIHSGTGGEAVVFDVDPKVLERLAGGRTVFDIVARAEEGKQTQIAVMCNFGELGDCGRKRYLVGYERADYLFEIDLPRGGPGSTGTIAIVSDVSNSGRALDIFEIRTAVAASQ